jgi:hypothetical protein
MTITIDKRLEEGYFAILDDGIGVAQTKSHRQAERIRDALNAPLIGRRITTLHGGERWEEAVVVGYGNGDILAILDNDELVSIDLRSCSIRLVRQGPTETDPGLPIPVLPWMSISEDDARRIMSWFHGMHVDVANVAARHQKELDLVVRLRAFIDAPKVSP